MLQVYILVGCPGSGKSTWSKKFIENDPSIRRVCPDEFRAIFGFGESDQKVSAKAFEATRLAVRDTLNDNLDVIVDATNMYPKARKQFLDIAKEYNAKTIAVIFEVDKNILLERNKKRGDEGGRNVPENIIDDMLSKYQRPDLNEFNDIRFISKIDI